MRPCGIKRTVDDVETVSNQAQLYKKQLYRELHFICEDQLSDKKAETLRSRIIEQDREYHQIFAFLDFPDAQPTNNHAEQSLRPMVIFRKICFGTRSPAGSCSHSVLPSLILTAQRQGHHPLAFLQTLFLSDTPTAQAALYDSS
ncbi:transposase [candidate division KSB3 bacterium]|nr:transposase [candidate division KSB3 bacterium]